MFSGAVNPLDPIKHREAEDCQGITGGGEAVAWGEIGPQDHPEKELTGAIMAAAIRIQKELGPGLLEDAYKACLAHALRQAGLKALREVRLDIAWEGLCIPNAYRMDLVVEDKVLVEAKTVERLVDAHFAQMNSYLRFSRMDLGLILNFRIWPLKDGGTKRVIRSHT